MKKENKKDDFKLVSKWVVGNAHDTFGTDVITEASFFTQLNTTEKQLLVFEGVKSFDSKLDAMEFLNNKSRQNKDGAWEPFAWTVVEVFVWKKVEEISKPKGDWVDGEWVEDVNSLYGEDK